MVSDRNRGCDQSARDDDGRLLVHGSVLCVREATPWPVDETALKNDVRQPLFLAAISPLPSLFIEHKQTRYGRG
jgi:hypothetical protein